MHTDVLSRVYVYVRQAWDRRLRRWAGYVDRRSRGSSLLGHNAMVEACWSFMLIVIIWSCTIADTSNVHLTCTCASHLPDTLHTTYGVNLTQDCSRDTEVASLLTRLDLPWPLNFHFMFDLLSLLLIGNAWLSYTLSPLLDRKKVETDAPPSLESESMAAKDPALDTPTTQSLKLKTTAV